MLELTNHSVIYLLFTQISNLEQKNPKIEMLFKTVQATCNSFISKLSELWCPSLEVWIMANLMEKWEKWIVKREFLSNKEAVLQSSSNIYSIWHHFQLMLQFSWNQQVHKSCSEVSTLASFWSGTPWYLSLGGVWRKNFEHVNFCLVICLNGTNRRLKFHFEWYDQGCV